MANHKSALKRARQNITRRTRNRSAKTKIKNVVKDVQTAIDENVKEAALEKLNTAKSAIDDTASKGIIHKNTAARRISRLTKRVNAIN